MSFSQKKVICLKASQLRLYWLESKVEQQQTVLEQQQTMLDKQGQKIEALEQVSEHLNDKLDPPLIRIMSTL